jgi:hypothetical protein
VLRVTWVERLSQSHPLYQRLRKLRKNLRDSYEQ